MDEVISRIPVIGQNFFEELNNESWIQCRIVGRFWCNFIDSQKLPWLRRIQIHSEQMKEFSEYWKKVLNKAPVEMVKALALATQLAFKKFPDLKKIQMSPHHVVIFLWKHTGSRELFQYIIEKTGDYNPKGQYSGTSPLHYAAGFFEVCSLIIENVDDKNPKNKEGITPLHIAAAQSAGVILTQNNCPAKNSFRIHF